jgi:hypothetical protein
MTVDQWKGYLWKLARDGDFQIFLLNFQLVFHKLSLKTATKSSLSFNAGKFQQLLVT